MRKLVLFIMAFIGLSCSSKWHLRRAIKKDPSILDTVLHQKDTVFVLKQDTLYLDSITKEFVYRLDTLLRDTCMLSYKKKHLITKMVKKDLFPAIIKSLMTDTLLIPMKNGGYVKLYMKGDSIIAMVMYKSVNIKDPYNYTESGWITFFRKNWWISIVLIVVCSLIFLRRIIS